MTFYSSKLRDMYFIIYVLSNSRNVKLKEPAMELKERQILCRFVKLRCYRANTVYTILSVMRLDYGSEILVDKKWLSLRTCVLGYASSDSLSS